MAFSVGDRVVVQTGVNEGKPGEVVYPLKDGRYFVILDGFSTTQGQRVYREASLKAEVVDPDPDPDPDPQPPATWFVSAGGNDGNPGSFQGPLASFAEAYRRAEAGDVVEVLAGSYGGQVLRRDTSKDGFDKPVVFKANGDVQLSGLSFGANYDDPGAWHVEVQGVKVNGWVNLRRTKNVTLRDVHLLGVHQAGGVNTQFIGGEWGPQPNPTGSHPEFTRYRSSDPVIGLLIEGVHIHHVGRPPRSAWGSVEPHTNALHVWGQGHRDITIRNCWFDHNDVFHSLISSDGVGGIQNVLFESNTFEPVTDAGFQGTGFYSVMVTGGVQNFSFKGNDFPANQPTVNQAEPVTSPCGNTGNVPASWKAACA